jgi:peptidoglycan-associated lipoprotein
MRADGRHGAARLRRTEESTMTLRTSLLLPLSLVAALAACSTPPERPDTTAPAAAPAAAPQAPPAAAQQPAPQSAVTTVTLPPHLDANSTLLRERSVHFDYDDFGIKREFIPLIERHGRYVAARNELALKLEGHADERGSAEYNLALGQRRAEAVLRALQLQGVRSAQMEAISWGEERPRANAHDEAAWAQNRRVDLQYPNR